MKKQLHSSASSDRIKGVKRIVLQQIPGGVLNKWLNEVMRLSVDELLQVRDRLAGLVRSVK